MQFYFSRAKALSVDLMNFSRLELYDFKTLLEATSDSKFRSPLELHEQLSSRLKLDIGR